MYIYAIMCCYDRDGWQFDNLSGDTDPNDRCRKNSEKDHDCRIVPYGY